MRNDNLTPREMEVAKLIAAGVRYRAIGNQLDIKEITVKKYAAEIRSKIGAPRYGTIAKVLLATVLCGTAFGQSLTLVSAPVAPGASGTVFVSLAGIPTGTSIAALEFTVSVPPGLAFNPTVGTIVAGNKSITCSAPGQSLTCIVWGSTVVAMLNGVVAQLTFTAPATGVTITLSNTLGADITGSSVAITAGAPLVLSVLSPCDLNGDGVVNLADVQIVLTAALTTTATTPDLNGDGKVNVIDVQRVVDAAAPGGTCRTGQ
jgi:DNA-binding CsgD family transcriptional regulator